MATPTSHGKAMSSRLAGMKFMQRAGASSPNTPTTPTTPAEPPSKKQRLSNGSSIRSPATPIDNAIAAEEQRRVEAVEKEAARKGETKWYLSFKAPQVEVSESPLRIVSAGFSALDAGRDDEPRIAEEDEETARPQVAGRKSFGNFGKAEKKKVDVEDLSEGSESEEEEDEIEDDPTGVKTLITKGRKEAADRVRAERKAKKAADTAEMQRLAEQRRKKGVNLNKVQSISSGGGGGPRGGRDKDSSYLRNMTCHGCGGTGHKKQDCPERGARR